MIFIVQLIHCQESVKSVSCELTANSLDKFHEFNNPFIGKSVLNTSGKNGPELTCILAIQFWRLILDCINTWFLGTFHGCHRFRQMKRSPYPSPITSVALFFFHLHKRASYIMNSLLFIAAQDSILYNFHSNRKYRKTYTYTCARV